MQHQPGAELAQAVALDMAAWWQPTADGYFQHVPKAAILEAVGEFAPEHVTRLAKLNKGDIAREAERLADGPGDRTRVGQGKSVSGSVHHGGRSSIKKKNTNK